MQNTFIQLAALAATVSAQYTYGGDCATTQDDDCGLVSGCGSCKWSWPTNDPDQWSSSEAKCRCEDEGTDGGDNATQDYDFGGDCATTQDDDCSLVAGCSSCKWSWSRDDPDLWSGDTAKCRCESGGSDNSNDDSSNADSYTYGGACATNTDDACANVAGCSSCKWSWPTNDPQQWSSSDAMCRCEGEGSNDNGGNDEDSSSGEDYGWGQACVTNQDDECANVAGCNTCKWSWSKDDPDLWDGDSAMCRCQTEDLIPEPIPYEDLTFGDDCASLTDDFCGDVDCIKCSFSWPSNDPLEWLSDDAACRCEYQEGEELPDERYPPLIVDVDGVDTTLYVQYPKSWSEATTEDTQLEFDYNNRMYLSTVRDLDVTKYFTPNMLGGSMEYDMDLSEVGCGCVTALYSILMPSVEDNEDEFKYCDANMVGGHWCPEFDLMEANKFAFHSTAHRCDAPTNGIYDNCDREGQCTLNVLTNETPADFIPGSLNGIDTNHEFHVKVDFQEQGGQFVGYTVTLTQGTKRVVMSTGDCSYLQSMTQDIQRMAFAISNWSGDNIDWLQHGACSGTCDKQNTYSTFSNLKFTTAQSTPVPPVPVDDTVYKYGDECGASADIELCGEDCKNCHMSWPHNDPAEWNSDDAACRCLPDQRAPQGYTYGDDQSDNSNAGLCDGNCDCYYSWPADDADQWNSAEAMYRCKPTEEEESIELHYGPDCPNTYDMLCGADCHQCRESWPANDPKMWYSDDMLCRCKPEDIREVVFGDSCASLDEGLCGTHCRECNMSWEATDLAGEFGTTADCRCKRHW